MVQVVYNFFFFFSFQSHFISYLNLKKKDQKQAMTSRSAQFDGESLASWLYGKIFSRNGRKKSVALQTQCSIALLATELGNSSYFTRECLRKAEENNPADPLTLLAALVSLQLQLPRTPTSDSFHKGMHQVLLIPKATLFKSGSQLLGPSNQGPHHMPTTGQQRQMRQPSVPGLGTKFIRQWEN